jgi:hypothetical protein
VAVCGVGVVGGGEGGGEATTRNLTTYGPLRRIARGCADLARGDSRASRKRFDGAAGVKALRNRLVIRRLEKNP